MMMGFGFAGMALLWATGFALLAGGVLWASRQLVGGRPPTGQHRSTPRQVLDDRLARGEIGADEHKQLRARIELE